MHCKISSLLPLNKPHENLRVRLLRMYLNHCWMIAWKKNTWKVQNLWQTWRTMKLNTVHAKILEWMLLANRYLQWRFCLQERMNFNIFCSTSLSELTSQTWNIIIPTCFNGLYGNFFSTASNSINPMLAVCNVLCNSIGHGAAAVFFHQASRKLRVMYTAKQPTKLLPS